MFIRGDLLNSNRKKKMQIMPMIMDAIRFSLVEQSL